MVARRPTGDRCGSRGDHASSETTVAQGRRGRDVSAITTTKGFIPESWHCIDCGQYCAGRFSTPAIRSSVQRHGNHQAAPRSASGTYELPARLRRVCRFGERSRRAGRGVSKRKSKLRYNQHRVDETAAFVAAELKNWSTARRTVVLDERRDQERRSYRWLALSSVKLNDEHSRYDLSPGIRGMLGGRGNQKTEGEIEARLEPPTLERRV
jgi:hypothetical protein